jgi:hypothetical protein
MDSGRPDGDGAGTTGPTIEDVTGDGDDAPVEPAVPEAQSEGKGAEPEIATPTGVPGGDDDAKDTHL